MTATLRTANVSDVTSAAILLHRARLASPGEILVGRTTAAHGSAGGVPGAPICWLLHRPGFAAARTAADQPAATPNGTVTLPPPPSGRVIRRAPLAGLMSSLHPTRTHPRMSTRPRITDSRLQTPVRFYRHPDTGRRITVVTTCHFGEPAYYQQLLATIAACTRAGAIVHSEGSHLVECADELTVAEREVIIERERVQDLMASLVAGLGWDFQKTAFAHTPDLGWQFIDVPTIESIRRMGTDKMLASFRAESTFLSRAAHNLTSAYLFRIRIAVALRLTTLKKKHRPQPEGHPDTVLLVERNQIALGAAHATDRDVVLVWGPSHLPGFDAALNSRGYLCDREDWHTALTPPSIPAALTGLLLRRPLATAGPRPAADAPPR